MYQGSTTFIILIAAASMACGSNVTPNDADAGFADAAVDAMPAEDLSAPLFDPERIIEVELSMDPGDWETLRRQGRDMSVLADCEAKPPLSVYGYFRAQAIIDGVPIDDVAARKKGFIGSLLYARPSFKLEFDEYVPGRRVFGLEHMTLNNNRQDPSLMHQCLAYGLFREVGIPAPRCNFAQVTVNGEDLGIYTHVESVDEHFLARNFANGNGDLFEGQLSDFTPELLGSFDFKGDPEDADRSALEGLTAALTAGDAELLTAVEEWLDIDAFLRMWAAESLMGHWDGYSSNRNNFFVYRDPLNGLLYFLPWGTDGALSNPAIDLGPRLESVGLTGHLAYRLYQLPEIRIRYVEVLRELLAGIWDENALLAEIDRASALVGDAASPGALDELRTYITGRRGLIEAEIAGGPAEWNEAPTPILCWRAAGTASGAFSTTWGTVGSPSPPPGASASLSITIDGTQVPLTLAWSTAGEGADLLGGSVPMIQLIGILPDDTPFIMVLFTERELFQGNSTIPFHAVSTFGIIVSAEGALVGFISSGTVQLEQAGTVLDDPVRGSFSGFVYLTPDASANPIAARAMQSAHTFVPRVISGLSF
jgi:hypothetical protein